MVVLSKRIHLTSVTIPLLDINLYKEFPKLAPQISDTVDGATVMCLVALFACSMDMDFGLDLVRQCVDDRFLGNSKELRDADKLMIEEVVKVRD